MTAPLALRVLKSDGPLARGLWIAIRHACGVKFQRVQRVVDCPAGNAYKISVTGLAFVSPKPHD